MEEDAFMKVPHFIIKYDYPFEEQEVETKDGYLLTVHRIPNTGHANEGKRRSPVLLQHGLYTSAMDFLIMGPNNSLAFLLADEGYDVWLGNTRGNDYSRNHKSLNPDSHLFWQFSWHKIGIYDMPAVVDYILRTTEKDKLDYIGHSQGTTVFFVMTSELPEYNDKIRLMISLSPIAFLSHIENPILKVVSGVRTLFNIIKDLDKLRALLPNIIANYEIPFKHFNHMDFVYGINVKSYVNDKIIEYLSSFNGTNN